MFNIERPYALLFLPFLVLVLIFSIIRYKKIFLFLSGVYDNKNLQSKSFSSLKASLILKTVFRIIACVFVILSFCGIFWGYENVAVQKNGNAVSFVFDISYSMNAKDENNGLTRLEAAKEYSLRLLQKMEGVSVSIVLAKGDGLVAVPLTEDYFALQNMIQNLSPTLMTSSGSSIGSGITAAIKSFPENSIQTGRIWVFTDGDETDDKLIPSLQEAKLSSHPVTLIGFGRTKPVEITAGDGKTKVKTSLNEEKLKSAVQKCNENSGIFKNSNAQNKISYIASNSESSAWFLLNEIQEKNVTTQSTTTQLISRHNFFILLGILFFVLSYFAEEFNTELFKTNSNKIKKISSVLILSSLFISCKNEKISVLSGTFSWYQKKYQSATADFLKVYSQAKIDENQLLSDYCAYNLASTYICQEEYDAAFSRLEQISEGADSYLKSQAFYNMGIICFRKGEFEKSEDYYKKAIIADSTNIEAKINLEFVQEQMEKRQTQSAEQKVNAVSIDKNENFLSNQIFNLIQTQEGERWKKLQQNEKTSDSLDY